MIGVMLPAESERKTVLKLVASGMRTDEIPEFLRKQEPAHHDDSEDVHRNELPDLPANH